MDCAAANIFGVVFVFVFVYMYYLVMSNSFAILQYPAVAIDLIVAAVQTGQYRNKA